MAYDAFQQAAPSQAVKEYLKIRRLAVKEGETPVDEVLRELLERKTEATISRLGWRVAKTARHD